MEENKKVRGQKSKVKSQESGVGSREEEKRRQNVYCIILVGGYGKRLWPLSRKEKPKPFLPLVTDKPMIRETVDRISSLFPKNRIRFVLREEHKGFANEIFPWVIDENFIVEPEARDTAGAIGLASVNLPKNAIIVVLSSDHYISDKQGFQKGIGSGLKFIKENPDFILTFGIKPKRPETGYGYIEKGDILALISGIEILKVKRFVEKPDIEKAKSYIKSKDYFWNSGIFIFKKERIEELFSIYLPEHYKVLLEKNMEKFKCLPKISIDHGIMEHIKTIGMIKAGFEWDDVGNYESLSRIHKKDFNNNIIFGDHQGIDTKDCIIYSENGKIGTIGVSNFVIAYSSGNILVTSRDRLDELKGLVERINDFSSF